MSASVWFEEVNTGLVNEILNTVQVISAEDNSKVPISENMVVVRKPEEDFKIEVFPCVSIYNRTSYHDPIRYSPEAVKVGRSIEDRTVTLEDCAIPFNLTYQIDFWARYQVDMDCMTRSWLLKHFRQFNLPVVDDGGTARTCNCLVQGSLVRSDLMENNERLLHSVINLEIWVEIDEQIRYNKPMVITRVVNAREKGE